MLHSYRADLMTVNHWVGGSSPSRGAKTSSSKKSELQKVKKKL